MLSPSELKLTPQGRSFVENTKTRRYSPLLQSQFEDRENQFFPAYSVPQVNKKDGHTIQILEKLNLDITKYNELSPKQQAQVGIKIIELLLAHPHTEFYPIAIGQGREPISIVLNRGQGDYPVKNHIALFERRPEICKCNPYISNYFVNEGQLKDFDDSKNNSTVYEDLMGNLHNETGPIIGAVKIDPTASNTSNTSLSATNDNEL